MFYLSSSSIKQAIESLSNVEHIGGRKAHTDLLVFYLILKFLGLEVNSWSLADKIYDKDGLLGSMLLLGGLASPEERPGKQACLFFTSFNKFKHSKDIKSFYNPSSVFKSLPSRLKDTIDNSAIDSLGSKNRDSIKFQRSISEPVVSNYSRKFSLYAVISWIYRFTSFEEQYNFLELKEIFRRQFNFKESELAKIFDISEPFEISYNNKPVSFSEIRKLLGVDNLVEIGKADLDYNLAMIDANKYHTELHMLFHENIDTKTLKDILETYKQVILTGVPGVGKSYFVRSLPEFEVYFVQFHQNYTYQDFIAGKTIEGGEVKQLEGDLILAIKQAESLAKDGRKLLLVLDEINRGNISSIFGELMFLLDRNGNKAKLSALNGLEIELPDNLYILGTMNSSDRSIAVIDYALRRRFPFVKLFPDYDLVNEFVSLEDKENIEFKQLGDFLRVLNERLVEFFNNTDFQVGHAVFMSSRYKKGDSFKISPKELLYIIFYEIVPLIVEYNNGDEGVITEVLSEAILNSKEEDVLEAIKNYVL